MGKYIRRPQAKEDLLEIWAYIAADNPAAADNLLRRIDKKSRTLADYPYMGRERSDIDPGLYSFPVGNYLIFYEHTDNGIEIVRVLHGARDVYSQF